MILIIYSDITAPGLITYQNTRNQESSISIEIDKDNQIDSDIIIIENIQITPQEEYLLSLQITNTG